MKPALTLGLRGRLILLLLAAFAALAGVIAWHVADHRQERIGTATENLLNRARVIAARQQYLASHAEAILNELMPHPELRERGSGKACTEVLSAPLRHQTEFLNIVKALPNGDLACAAISPKGGFSVADRNYFQQALKTREMVVGDVIAGRIQDKPTIAFAKAMRDDAGRAFGVLVLGLDLGWLSRELASTNLPEGAQLVVVDNQGTVAVQQPDPDQWVGRSALHMPVVKRVLSHGGEGTLEEVGLDGSQRIYGFTPLMNSISGRMVLWLSMPKEVVDAPARRELMLGLGILLAVLLGALGLVAWGGNRLLLQPLLTLSRVAARFGAGDLGARTGLPHGDDEVGRLAKTLDGAAVAIEDRERKLARANRALRVLSAGNQALLRSRSGQELPTEMCRAIVEAGGYRIAWVGYAEHDPERSVRTVAAWGVEKDFVDGLKITWGETESGRGPTGTAIRRGIPIAANDLLTHPDYAPWRERAQRYGYASSLALPLRIDGAVIGALNIYAAEPDAFDDDIVELLSEAADDLAFGIATQRAQAEHGRTRTALQTAEDRFRAAAEGSLDALFILVSVHGEHGGILDFEFTDINARAEQMLGMTREQIVGQKLCELIPIYRTRGFFDKYVAVVTTGVPLEEEFPIDTPEIKAKWLRHQVARVGDGIAISSRDITVWKEAGAALRESTERFRIATESVRDAFIILDSADGAVTWWNAAAETIFGYRSDEIVGRRLHDILVPDRLRGAARRGLEQFAVTGEGAAVGKATELAALRKSGEEFPIELSLSSMRLHDKWFAVGIVHDITERKKNEQALVRANRALRTLSAGNEALVRANSEEGLLQAAVRIIVEIGGYRMAGVGYAQDDAEKSINPMAWAGVEEGYIAEGIQTWADTEAGQRPISRAIRSGQPEHARDIPSDPAFADWRDAAAKRGYASNLALPLSDGTRTIGALNVYAVEPNAFDAEETQLLAQLANDLAYGIVTLRTRAERDRIAYAHAHHAEILQKSLEQSIRVIADTVEARDPYTAGHQRRVRELAVAIAREMGLPEEKIHGIRLAAAIHDLGKIHVPAEILAKPGKLTDIEFMLIKTHPQTGYDILKDVDFPWPIADIVRQHHEKLDGSGYPQGLKGGQILPESRIMAVADVVEAMSSHRPYRPALGIEAALKEIERGRGSAYDPAVVDSCLKLFREERFAFQ